ncbi:hypothetical protein SRABI70_03206 [Pseudomonas sp. Bi70]|uniref:hypothetical protein n=1 Tax=Pseudomonas sp. Bi70 TaxID=2821127 RepID=UPI001E0B90B2|nr:hypothetical protein [Pseudomonas sp. Bi70]CAH0260760.1 hypothetical protein SRABI70_03206 [Pseudomonas sp. Bi70]
MPTTWIEIADTAIKIGLGAAISGASAFLINRQSHNKSLEKENYSRNKETLESVALSIEELTHALLKYWSYILDWAKNNEKGVQASKEKIDSITELRGDVFNLFKGLTNSEGRLLLIGCVEQQKKLREYGSLISEFYRYASRNNEQMQSSELEVWRAKILEAREQLYSSLNKSYRAVKT